MRKLKILFVLILCGANQISFAQEMPAAIKAVLKADDTVKMAAFFTKDNLNDCYTEGSWPYTLLAQTIRYNAKKCFDLLIEKGADVNKACQGYVPPLMHAAKYGRLDMAKILVAKGADINYKYSGDYSYADGETPLTYAEKTSRLRWRII